MYIRKMSCDSGYGSYKNNYVIKKYYLKYSFKNGSDNVNR